MASDEEDRAGRPPGADPSSVLAAIGHAVMTMDLSGRIQCWNRAAADLYGYSAGEAAGRPLVDVIAPAGDEDPAVDWTARLHSGASYSGDWRARDKAGRVFVANVTITPLFDDHGSIAGSVAVSYDASSQREAEGRARQLAAIVDGSDDAILAIGPDGHIRFANQAVEATFGYPLDDLIGRHVAVLVPDERAADLIELTDAVLAGQRVGVLSTRRERADGSRISTKLHLSPVRDVLGTVVGASIRTRDVTAEIAMRVELETSERRYRARFDQAGMPQAFTDLRGRLLVVNAAFCRLLGRTREEMEGLPLQLLRHPTDPDVADDRLGAVLEGRAEATSWERMLARGDGEPVPVLVHVTLLRDADGDPDGVAAFFQDLSALRNAESALIRREAKFAVFALRASEWVAVMDVSGTFLYVSPSVKRLLGYDSALITGRSGWDFVHPDDLQEVQRTFDAVARTPGSSRTADFRVIEAGGQWLWIEQSFTNCISDPDIAGVVCNGRDVTGRVLAEQSLRESEARYRAIAETRRDYWQ